MKGNDNKFLTGGFTMKSISRIYLSIISFISFVRAFVMAAGVVVLSATLMFNCATTKSADTSSRYVAESTTTSQEVKDYREIAKNAKELQELVNKAAELASEALRLEEQKEQALKAAEQARLKEEQACKGMYNALMEMKELCKKGDMENCEEYKKDAPIYEKECGGK